MTARFSLNQRNTRGHRPRLQGGSNQVTSSPAIRHAYCFMMARMPIEDQLWLSFEDSNDYDRVRETFLRANYTVPGVLEVVGLLGAGTVTLKDVPKVLDC